MDEEEIYSLYGQRSLCSQHEKRVCFELTRKRDHSRHLRIADCLLFCDQDGIHPISAEHSSGYAFVRSIHTIPQPQPADDIPQPHRTKLPLRPHRFTAIATELTVDMP